MKMRYLSRVCFASVLILAASFQSAYAEVPFKIGVILPLAGDAAAYGVALQHGIEIARAELPEELQKTIEIFYEDDGLKSAQSVAAFRRLTTEKGIQVLINATSGTGNALAPLAEQRALPFISIASDRRISTGKKYVVNFLVSPEDEGKVLVAEAKRRGYKKIARVSTLQEGVVSLREGFERNNQGALEVLVDDEYPPESKDFKPFITRVRSNASVDAILLICIAGHCGTAAKQIRDGGITVPIFGYHTLEDKTEIESSQGGLKGAWYVGTADPSARLVAQLAQRTSDQSLLWLVAYGHDALVMIVNALQKEKSTESVNRYLHEVQDLQGAVGRISATSHNDFTLPVAVKVIQ
jgi:branched-chain amino acid transport system substrate-binding protein